MPLLREVVIGSETQTITQTETVDSAKKDMETVLELLPQEKETTTEDGFTGTLHLVLDSIKTEPAGYGSSTKPVSVVHLRLLRGCTVRPGSAAAGMPPRIPAC